MLGNVFSNSFTIDEIKAAHAKVKSGADFPMYIQEIIRLGVKGYENYVSDGHAIYFGPAEYEIRSEPKYTELAISDSIDKQLFHKYLRAHQQGQSDYLTFCKYCAETGVEKWTVCLDQMTCTYYDKRGNEILVEIIPSP